MFKNLTIQLEKPICDCGSEHLKWNINTPGALTVWCASCQQSLVIGKDELRASFAFEDSNAQKVWRASRTGTSGNYQN